jgi:hypothetical protein
MAGHELSAEHSFYLAIGLYANKSRSRRSCKLAFLVFGY